MNIKNHIRSFNNIYIGAVRIFVVVATTAGVFLFASTLHCDAAAGDLDLTFGNAGKVVTRIGNAFDFASAMAIQADGKIVAAGRTSDGPFNSDSNNFALARYNIDGSLDTSFGTAGKVVTNIGLADTIQAIAIQSDGKIVAAGFSSSSLDGYFALARYNIDGLLDTSFGTGGIVTTPNSRGYVSAVAIQPDGKIVAVGSMLVGWEDNTVFLLVRYNANGTSDTSFGTNGRVTTQFNNNYFPNDVPYALAIQPDGKIIAAGTSYDKMTTLTGLAVSRYNMNGSLDASFGGGGLVVGQISGVASEARALAIQSGGKIVMAVYNQGESNFRLARLNTNGSLDAAFGSGGVVVTSFGVSSHSTAMAIQSNGRIVAAGYAGEHPNLYFALARYNINGSLDTTFGTGGKVVTPVGASSDAAGVAIQADGRIVAVGSSRVGINQFAFAVARYLGDSPTAAVNVWSSHGPNAEVRKVVVDTFNPNIIYAGTGLGIFKSINGGESWSAVNQGLGNIDIHSLAIDPSNPNILYTGTSNGAFKTVNGGANWNLTLSGHSTALSIAASNPSIIYAANYQSIYVTTNGGATWNQIFAPDQLQTLNLLVVDPNDPNIVFVAFDNYKDFFSTIYKSTNGGASWTVFYYRDTGGLITYDLKIDAGNSNLIYASTYGGVYKSSDGGASWALRGSPVPSGAGALAIDPNNSNTLYATSSNENVGVYKSTDGGVTWRSFNNGLTNLQVNNLSFDSTGRFLHAATPTGVFSVRVRGRILPIATALDALDAP